MRGILVMGEMILKLGGGGDTYLYGLTGYVI